MFHAQNFLFPYFFNTCSYLLAQSTSPAVSFLTIHLIARSFTPSQPLKRALGRMGAPNLVPDNLDNSLSFQVTNHLKKLKNQAKLEYERICLEVCNGKGSLFHKESIMCTIIYIMYRWSYFLVMDIIIIINIFFHFYLFFFSS